MDPFEELERMALNAEEETFTEEQALEDHIERWQRLFDYSYADAIAHFKEQKSDLTRLRVSDEHWQLVRAKMEDKGYDRDSYEHELGKNPSASTISGVPQKASPSPSDNDASFIFKLEDPLDEPGKIQKAAKLSNPPDIVNGVGEEGDTKFCRVDTAGKHAIEEWLSQERLNYRPTFIRLSQAKKDLSSTSARPTLGVDTTLPQHRPQEPNIRFLPEQNQYPVWYFFYGTLANPEILSGLLGLSEEERPVLQSATISHAVIKSWGGKYKALVDGPSSALVDGWAYQVTSKVHEETLLFYETANYEVVRCTILMHDKDELGVKGCTFRFIDSSALS